VKINEMASSETMRPFLWESFCCNVNPEHAHEVTIPMVLGRGFFRSSGAAP
jgi:hypothetical protein